uniref:NADH dehydrogenase subunit 4L n=1 Tax=Chlorogomphus shanicus TaxID=2077256 RepID=UPI0023AA4278|nr:NADH dehydrogenase subunit 4L [Chlorogomphus shanicus]WCO11401.1 NADH dehydrogenase subunit 4L [Chlorogomphus shanicus]
MLIFYNIIFFVLIFSGVCSFVSKRKHLLSTLLSLEFIVLGLFFYMFFVLIVSYYDLCFLMYFLTFGVCEGALGLSILVSMIRTHGNDYFNNFSMLQC